MVVISSVIYESTCGPWVTALPLHTQPTLSPEGFNFSLPVWTRKISLRILHPIHWVDSASSDYMVHLPTSCLHAYSGLHVRNRSFESTSYIISSWLHHVGKLKSTLPGSISCLGGLVHIFIFCFFLFSLFLISLLTCLSSKNKLSILHCPSPPNILYAVPVSILLLTTEFFWSSYSGLLQIESL